MFEQTRNANKTGNEHRLYLAPKQEDVVMGSAIAKTHTANVCKAGLARLQRIDKEQRRAPQAALAKLIFVSKVLNVNEALVISKSIFRTWCRLSSR